MQCSRGNLIGAVNSKANLPGEEQSTWCTRHIYGTSCCCWTSAKTFQWLGGDLGWVMNPQVKQVIWEMFPLQVLAGSKLKKKIIKTSGINLWVVASGGVWTALGDTLGAGGAIHLFTLLPVLWVQGLVGPSRFSDEWILDQWLMVLLKIDKNLWA